MRKIFRRLVAGIAVAFVVSSTVTTSAFAATPLPGATRYERYEMSPYADIDDEAVLKQSVKSLEKNSYALESAFLKGTQIADLKDIEGGWRLLTLGNYENILNDEYEYERYTNCYIRPDEEIENGVTVVFNYGCYFDPNVVNPNTGLVSGANIDQTEKDPEILNGSASVTNKGSVTKDTYPYLNIQVGNRKMDMYIYQFTKTSDGKEYAFGRIYWKDGDAEKIILARDAK